MSHDEIERRLADEWQERIAASHAKMQTASVAGEVPSPERWPGYAWTRAWLLRDLAVLAQRHPPTGTATGRGTLIEKLLAAPDGTLHGRLDRVEHDADGVHIIDLKTSPTATADLPSSHRQQLLVYAALWKRCQGEWPVRASIEHLGADRQTIAVDPKEAEATVTSLLALRDDFNRRVRDGARPGDLASPSPEGCAYCDFRGACLPFLVAASEDWGWFRRTVVGQVDDVVEDEGSNDLILSVVAGNLAADVRQARVKGFHRDVAPDIGTWLAVVDAQRTGSANILKAAWDTQLWIWPARPALHQT